VGDDDDDMLAARSRADRVDRRAPPSGVVDSSVRIIVSDAVAT
jgi:hypothetical protein